MSNIITVRGQLPIGVEEKIHLSTNDGLTGYRIKKFQLMPSTPGTATAELVGKIRLKADPNIGPTVDLSDSDIIAVCYYQNVPEQSSGAGQSVSNNIILDKETFNQDIFISVTDATTNTAPANFYIEIEKFTLNLNESTYHTVKNIRSATQA